MIGSTTLLLSTVLASVAKVDKGRETLSPEEWDQRPRQGHRRRKRQRQLIETQRFIQAMQASSPATFAEAQSSSSSPPQSIRRMLATEDSEGEGTTNQSPRQSSDLCQRAAQSYAVEGGNCTCMYDPVTAEIVTFDCHFPKCEKCILLGGTDLLCATISTRAMLTDLAKHSDKPAEVSYTECFTYTKGRSDTLCYTEFLNSQGQLFNECFLDVNGEFCNSCRADMCEGSQVEGLSQLDCSNVEGGHEWNFCDSGGVFDPPVFGDSVFLAFADPSVFGFNKCTPDPVVAWKPFLDHEGNVDLQQRMYESSWTANSGYDNKPVSWKLKCAGIWVQHLR